MSKGLGGLMMAILNKEQELMEHLDLDFDEMDVDFDFDDVSCEFEEEEKEASSSNDEQSRVDGILDKTKAQEDDGIVESEEEFDLTGFTTVSSTNNSKRSVGARGRGGLSIINSQKNGKRITLTKKWWEALGKPTEIQLAMKEKVLVLGENLGEDFRTFSWITKDQKPVLYHSSLVEELVQFYQLDYSNGRTSLSFGDIQLKRVNGQPALVIQMK